MIMIKEICVLHTVLKQNYRIKNTVPVLTPNQAFVSLVFVSKFHRGITHAQLEISYRPLVFVWEGEL